MLISWIDVDLIAFSTCHQNDDDVMSCTTAELGPCHNVFHGTVGGRPALIGLITGGPAKKASSLMYEARREAGQYPSTFFHSCNGGAHRNGVASHA